MHVAHCLCISPDYPEVIFPTLFMLVLKTLKASWNSAHDALCAYFRGLAMAKKRRRQGNCVVQCTYASIALAGIYAKLASQRRWNDSKQRENINSRCACRGGFYSYAKQLAIYFFPRTFFLFIFMHWKIFARPRACFFLISFRSARINVIYRISSKLLIRCRSVNILEPFPLRNRRDNNSV